MSPTDALGDPSFWLYFLVWLPFVLFTVLYSLRRPWRSPIGRSLLTMAGSIVLVLTNVMLSLVFGFEYAARDEIRGVLLGLVGVAAWYQLYNLLRTRSQGKRGRPDRAREID